VDQLERANPGDAGKIADYRTALDRAEKAPEAERRKTLTELATRLERDASGAADAVTVRTLAGAVRDLAAAPHLAQR
jgi:hypothetical protein